MKKKKRVPKKTKKKASQSRRKKNKVTERLLDVIEHSTIITKTQRDILDAVRSGEMVLTHRDVRFMVGLYYQAQRFRVGEGNRISKYPDVRMTRYIFRQFQVLEDDIKRNLDAWTDSDPVSRWAKSIHGIGPVIAAGMRAHIDMDIAKTPSQINSFIGWPPKRPWLPHTKRPWNAELRKICWHAGQCFKRSKAEKSKYRKFYEARKGYEVARNQQGEFAKLAEEILSEKKFRKDTEAYKHLKRGLLPPAHIDARACRWTAKLFIAHWWEVAYRHHYGEEPAKPFAIQRLGHAKWITSKEVS